LDMARRTVRASIGALSHYAQRMKGKTAMKASMMLYPVDRIDTALPFFVDGLGLTVKMRDGERYCALDGGALTIALVAGDERIVERPALTFRVAEDDDLGRFGARARAARAA
jgi:hypothetical protein